MCAESECAREGEMRMPTSSDVSRYVSAIRNARMVCVRAVGYMRSRAIRATVRCSAPTSVSLAMGQIADLLGLVDRAGPVLAVPEERERARAVGYRLRLGAGAEVQPSPRRPHARESLSASAVRLREPRSRPCGVPCPVRIGPVVACVENVG